MLSERRAGTVLGQSRLTRSATHSFRTDIYFSYAMTVTVAFVRTSGEDFSAL